MNRSIMKRCVVIGAGIGGLTTAAILARAGADVTVLEAQVYPGGCAGTFYHQGYRFDAGATLAGGFYPGGPMDLLARSAGIERWPTSPAEPAMRVHLPNGNVVDRWGDERRWDERLQAFGPGALDFWHWQERTADAMWDLALRLPTWPPRTPSDVANLASDGLAWVREGLQQRIRPRMILDAVRPISERMKGLPEDITLFVDAQLLISAQTTSRSANALFGAAALDLPRRGVVHMCGGMGGIADLLMQSLKKHNGKIHFRQEATRVVMEKGQPVAVKTRRGDAFDADVIVFNLPAPNIAKIMKQDQSDNHTNRGEQFEELWGAFVVYVGVDEQVVPKDLPLHHQTITGLPLGEGNTTFLSISPSWDHSRAPRGKRAITMSTHTVLEPWWHLKSQDPIAYQVRKGSYTEALLRAGKRVLPGLKEAAELVLPGTPVTFQRFTGRAHGWVGGYPQTHLLKFRAPRLSSNLWMVGDSIFPGQSTAAVALGGLRVAKMIIKEHLRDTQRSNILSEVESPIAVGS